MPVTDAAVLVTGATGFIAAELVKQLLEAGYKVRGTTRDVAKAKGDGFLTKLAGANDRLELVEADLVDSGAYNSAVVGCEYLMHVASPYVLDVDDPKRDILEPAVNGTLSVFESAIQTEGVKRVVLTSSFAAISGGSKEGTWTEDDWNTTSSLESGSYPYSKTMAERAAWEFMKNRDTSFDLIVINPTGVIGPSIVSRINQTHEFFSNMTKGEYPGIIGFEFPFVDVRDVARAHILAMETPRASGRYITSAGTASFRHMVDLANEAGYGEKYKLPSLSLDTPFGNVLLRLAANFQPKGTRDFLKTAVGKTYVLDNSKIKTDLSMDFRDLDQSIIEAMNDLEAWGHLGN